MSSPPPAPLPPASETPARALDLALPEDTGPRGRDVVTQHAFRIAPALLGLPLASPWQRAFAIGIDALLVVLLAKTGGILLAALAAVFVYGRLRAREQQRDLPPRSRLGRRLSASGRTLLALLIFSIAVSLLQPLWERYVDNDDDGTGERAAAEGLDFDAHDGIELGLAVAALKSCDAAPCRADAARRAAEAFASARGSAAQRRDAYAELLADTVDDPAERARLLPLLDGAPPDGAASAPAPGGGVPAPAAPAPATVATTPPPAAPEYSLVKQLFGLLDDLGLSLGWAAAYFTLFTTLWAGQTPGKKLLGIRVVELTGKPLGYWTSFERYGGYGAGFTTGLLGFLQVYWKPNRQAIQDQLTFTAVIRDR